MTFKNGDKVVVTRDMCCGLRAGDTGTVQGDRFTRDSDALTHPIDGWDETFKLVSVEHEVGKRFKLTAEPTTASGVEAFTSTRPKPTEVTVVRGVASTGNIYVVDDAGTHQWIDDRLLGDEVVKAEEATPVVAEAEIKVGDKVEITRRPDGSAGGSSGRLGQTGEVVTLSPAGGYLSDEATARVKFADSPGDGTWLYRDQIKLVKAEPLSIVVGEYYKLLPNAFTNEGTPSEPLLRGYVSSSWKEGFPSVRVRSISSFDNVDLTVDGRYQTVHKSFLAPLDAPAGTTDAAAASAAVDALNTRIRDLEARVSTLQGSLAASQERHRIDVAKIGEKFIEEADSRGWCEEYDTFVRDEVNPYISVELPTREKEFEVVFTFQQSITVTAIDEDSAIEAAREADEYKKDGYYGNLDETDYKVEEA